MCDDQNCNCGGSCCGDCEPWNCVEQAVNDVWATKEGQIKELVQKAEDAADRSEDAADRSEDAAKASADSASEAKGFRDEAEKAATTAVAAEGTVIETAGILQETGEALRRIANQLEDAIAGIAVVPYYYTIETQKQTKIVLPAEIKLANVQSIYIEGTRQDPGEDRGFTYDNTTRTVTLAHGLPKGMEITLILGTYNADNPEDFSHTLASVNGASLVGTSDGQTVQVHLNALNDLLGNSPKKVTYNIPGDFADWTEAAAYFSKVGYWGSQVIINIAAGEYTWATLPEIFGTTWGNGRLQFVGAGINATVIKFDKVDGIYAPFGHCFGKAPQFPVAGGDVVPIIKGATLSGIDRTTGIDDPYRDAMGIRAFDGGMVVLTECRITQFSRVGVMAERMGKAFVPGITVDTTGSDCVAASESGYIYCPNVTADNPKGHCFIGYSGGHLYMPNCVAKNAVLHPPANVGGSGFVLTGGSYGYAINLETFGNAQRGVSIAVDSSARLDKVKDHDNGLPFSVSQDSTAIAPNAVITRASGTLAVLLEKGGSLLCQLASTDTFTVTGRITVQSLSTLHAPDGTVTNSSGTSVAVINSRADLDRTKFMGAPAVAIWAQDGANVKCAAGSSVTTSGTTIIAQAAQVSADNFTVGGTPSNGFRAYDGGRISAKGASVAQAGQYGFTAEGLGAFINAVNSTIGNAFTAYRANNGGQIYATGSNPTGTYDSNVPYIPAINSANAQLTIIVK